MNEFSVTILPLAHKIPPHHEEQVMEDRTLNDLVKEASESANNQSTKKGTL